MKKKSCTKCKDIKGIVAFRKTKSGFQSWCKACESFLAKQWRIENRERYRQIFKDYYERNKEKMRKRGRDDFQVNKVKCLARHLAFMAVRKGEIKKLPCQICGETKVDAHHEDYTKPLAVIWLCKPHHAQLHAGKFTLLQEKK